MDLCTPRYAPYAKCPPHRASPGRKYVQTGVNFLLLLIFPASVSSFSGWRCRWAGLGLAFCHLGTAGANFLWNRLWEEGGRAPSFGTCFFRLQPLSGHPRPPFRLLCFSPGGLGWPPWVGGWMEVLLPPQGASVPPAVVTGKQRQASGGRGGRISAQPATRFSLRLPRSPQTQRDCAGHGFSLEVLVPSLPSHGDSAA